MAQILLDACVPHWLRAELGLPGVVTAKYAGLDQLSDKELLSAIEGRFDILVTLDGSLSRQQNLEHRPFSVIVIKVSDQSPRSFRAILPALIEAIGEIVAGQVVQVQSPTA